MLNIIEGMRRQNSAGLASNLGRLHSELVPLANLCALVNGRPPAPRSGRLFEFVIVMELRVLELDEVTRTFDHKSHAGRTPANTTLKALLGGTAAGGTSTKEGDEAVRNHWMRGKPAEVMDHIGKVLGQCVRARSV
jgi:hypothetical protein